MQALFALILSFSGYFSNLDGDSTQPYPAYLEGREGFLYILQVDSNSRPLKLGGKLHFFNPVMAEDGSPLYVGRKKLSKASVKVSLMQLFDEFLLASEPAKQLAFQSKIWPAAVQLKIEPGFLAKLLNDWGSKSNEEKNSGGVIQTLDYDEKENLLEQILFEDELVLTAGILKSIRQSDLVTEPVPLQLEIPISSALDLAKILGDQADLALHPWSKVALSYLDSPASSVFDFFWKMAIVIQVEELGFVIREKKIVFDAQNNLVRVVLLIDKAHIAGPLLETGEMRTLFDWRGHEKKYFLERGELSGMQLSIGFELIPPSDENPDFWALETKKDLVDVKFLENPTPVSLNIPEKSEEPLVVSLGGSQYDQVLDALAQEISKAFMFRFFSERFAFVFDRIPNQPSREVIEFKNWVNSVAYDENQLLLSFDSRYELPEIASCIENQKIDRPWRYVSQKLVAKKAESIWGLVWSQNAKLWQVARWENSEEAKKEATEFVSSSARIEVQNHIEWLEWMSQAFWLAGDFCFDSGSWWPRPKHLPLMKAFLTQPPSFFTNEEGESFLEVNGQLQVFERETHQDSDAFSKLSFSKSFQSLLPLSFSDQSVDWVFTDLQLQGLSSFENELVKKMLLRGFQKIFGLNLSDDESDFESFDIISWIEKLTNENLAFKETDWTKNEWRTLLEIEEFTDFFKEREQSQRVQRREIPETEILNPPPYIVDDRLIQLSWQSRPSENITYSWRVVHPGQLEAEANWSSFSSDKNLQLILDQEGLYTFEVRGMNSAFEIEFPSQARIQFYYLGADQELSEPKPSVQKPERSKRSSSEVETQSEVLKSDKAKASDSNTRGVFGCSLNAHRTEASFGFWVFLSLFAFFIFRFRIQTTATSTSQKWGSGSSFFHKFF